MGQHPMRIKEFREYLRVVRTLLKGEAVEYTYAGRTREIQFLHQDLHYLDLEHPHTDLRRGERTQGLRDSGRIWRWVGHRGRQPGGGQGAACT